MKKKKKTRRNEEEKENERLFVKTYVFRLDLKKRKTRKRNT